MQLTEHERWMFLELRNMKPQGRVARKAFERMVRHQRTLKTRGISYAKYTDMNVHQRINSKNNTAVPFKRLNQMRSMLRSLNYDAACWAWCQPQTF